MARSSKGFGEVTTKNKREFAPAHSIESACIDYEVNRAHGGTEWIEIVTKNKNGGVFRFNCNSTDYFFLLAILGCAILTPITFFQQDMQDARDRIYSKQERGISLSKQMFLFMIAWERANFFTPQSLIEFSELVRILAKDKETKIPKYVAEILVTEHELTGFEEGEGDDSLGYRAESGQTLMAVLEKMYHSR